MECDEGGSRGAGKPESLGAWKAGKLRALIACAAVLVAGHALAAQSAYVPQRVFDSARGQFSDFESMLDDIAKADAVFVGEQHDDPNTHRLELAVLQGVARRHADSVTVAVEMFERDVQEPLVHFGMGHMSEEDFLKVSRPWPRYATDYKPLVDFANSKDWPIVASNVPRSIASEVSKLGWDALAKKSDAERAWFAADRQCPTNDDYFARFVDAMGDHPTGPAPAAGAAAVPAPDAAAKRQELEHFYFAQCLKDETMGESVAKAFQVGGPHALVVHFNGAFHSDFAEGTAARAARRMPGKRIVVISILPVDDIGASPFPVPAAAERKRADYLVYTQK